ncbi:MAG TPA: serine hydrolase domain-containing protein [Mycobacteriales bacterium]|nr:serine hydrolase domain-containing protein [Mycobacteriales bacterium]
MGDLGGALRELGLSGIATIRGPGGTVEYEECFGLADRAAGTPNTPSTRFALASVTKMFTAATVLRLGVDPAAPVVSLLPPERRPATLRPDVTVHHLLSHTSHIADYAEEEGPVVVDYEEIWVDHPCYRFERPADFLPLFGDLPPYGPPKDEFHYCNAAYVVLGLIVEEVSGLSYVDAVGREVFAPAGMARSGFFRSDEPVPDVAVGYLESGRTNVFSVPVIGGADGGAHSTAEDLDRFLRAVDDGSLLGDRREVMLTPRVEVGEDDMDYGYGCLLYGDGRFGHGGGDPGCTALIQRIPARDTTVVVVCNTYARVGAARNLMVDAVLDS